MAADGNLRGEFRLRTAPARQQLRQLREEADRTDVAFKKAGQSMDRLGTRPQRERVRGFTTDVRSLRRESETTARRLGRAFRQMERSVDTSVGRMETRVDGLNVKLRELGGSTYRPKVELDGVAAALTELRALNRELSRTSRRVSSPRVSAGGLGAGVLGGAAGGGGGSGRGVARRAAGGAARGAGKGLGLGPKIGRFPVAALAAGLPVVNSLVGAVGSLGSVAVSAGLGLGALGVSAGVAAVSGIAPLVAVLKPLKTQLEGVQKASEKRRDAIAQYGARSKEAAKAQRELNRALADAPRGAQGLLSAQGRVAAAYGARGARRADPNVRAAQAQAVQSGTRLMGIAAKAAPMLGRGAVRSLNALDKEIGPLGKFLLGETGKQATNFGAGVIEDNVRNVRRMFQYAAEGFVNVARAARPFLTDGVGGVTEMAKGFATSTRNIGQTREKLRPFMEDLRRVKDLGGAAFGTLKALFNAGGRSSGGGLLESATRSLRSYTDSINKNPAQVREFFDRSVSSVQKLSAAIVELTKALFRIGETLRPVLDRFSSLVTLAGKLGLFTPGASSLLLGGLLGGKAGFGRGAGAAAGVLGGGAGALGGGAAAAEAAALASGFGPRGARPGAPVSQVGPRRGALRRGAGRLGAAGRGAAGGALRRFLPVGIGLGALDYFTATEGSRGDRAQNALSTATLGLVPRTKSNDEIKARAGKKVGEFTKKNLSRLPQTITGTRVGNARLNREIAGESQLLSALKRAGKVGEDGAKDLTERIRLLKEERTEIHRTNRALEDEKTARNRERSLRRGDKINADLTTGFARRQKRDGTASAIRDTTTAALGQAGKVRNNTAIPLLTRQYKMLRGEAQKLGDPKISARVNDLAAAVVRRYRKMGETVRFVNGSLVRGTRTQWASIASTMVSQANKGMTGANAAFRAVNAQAVASLENLGYSKGAAGKLISSMRAGGSRAADANAAVSSGGADVGSSLRAGGTSTPNVRSGNTGGRGPRSGDGLGYRIGGAAPEDRKARSGAAARSSQVATSNGGGNLMGAKSGLSVYANDAATYGLRVSSGARPGAITSSGNVSYHSSGDALDLAGAPAQMLAFARHARDTYGSRLEELIHTPMGAGIKNGQPFTYTGQVAADHYDHVHIADTAPGGAATGGGVGGGGGAMGGMGPQKIGALKGPGAGGLKGIPGAMVAGAGALYAAGLTQAVNKALAAGGGGGAADYSGKGVMSFTSVAKLAESVGLPGVTFAQIAKGESGFNPRAVGHDPGGTQGLGLWQITTGFNDDIIAQFGGREAMFNPNTNAQAAKAIYSRQGIGAWYGTKYMTGTNLHYQGDGLGWDKPGAKKTAWGGWNAKGGSGVTNGPTLFGAGEKGKERVTITPVKGGGGGMSGGVHVTMQFGDVRVSDQQEFEDMVDKAARVVAERLNEELEKRGA